MNRKAQLFTLDLLLALIPLTLVLGYSASAMSGVITQIQEYSYFYSNQRMVNDAIDVLIKTPGEPLDWNATNPPNITGLAGYDSETNKTFPNQLDLIKISALEASFLENVLGNFSYYNLTLENVSGEISFYRNWSSGSSDDASSIFVAERVVTIPLNIVANATTDEGGIYTIKVHASDDVYGTQEDGVDNDSMTFYFPNLGIPSGSLIDSVIVIVEHHESSITDFPFNGEDGVDNTESRPRDDVKVWNGSDYEYIEDYGVSLSDKNYISRDFSDIINTPALANGVQLRMYYDPKVPITGAIFYADYAVIQVTYTYLGRTYDVPAPSFARLRLEAGR